MDNKLKYYKYKKKYLNLKYNNFEGGKLSEIKFIGEFKQCVNLNKDCHNFDGIVLDEFDNKITDINTAGIWKENKSINNIKNITFTDINNKALNYSWKSTEEWRNLKDVEFEKVKSLLKTSNINKQIITSGFYNPINILTWNLGWINGESAGLGEKCQDRSICTENISNFINMQKYDFISLQQASNWNEIYNNKLNKNMGIMHYLINNIEIVTLYDKNRFNPIYLKIGNFKKQDAYNIIFFEEKNTIFKYIIIHINTSEILYISELETWLNTDITKCLQLEQNTNIYDLNKYQKNILVDIKEYVDNNKFKIIIFGDFNEYNDHKKKRSFWTGLNILNNKISSNGEKPPKTCCDISRTSASKKEDYNSSYILINSELSYIVNCNIPEHFERNASIYPTSDHLPVEAIII